MNSHLLPKVLISIICIVAVIAIMLRGDETPVYDGAAVEAGEDGAVDGFAFEPEELVYDGKGELNFLEGVSLPGFSAQELKKLVYVRIQTSGSLSSKKVEYTADTENGRFQSVRKLHLSGYTGPKIRLPQHTPEVTPDTVDQFDKLLMSEKDFFVDDGFGNDASEHMEIQVNRSRYDSSLVSYNVSIENVFGDRDLVTCDIILSGEYSVIALTTPEVVLSRGAVFEPSDFVARAEKPDGMSALNEVIIRGGVDTTTPGNYTLTYEFDGQSVELDVLVE